MSLRKSKLSKIVSLFGMAAIVVATFAFALTTTSVEAAEYSYEWVSQTGWPTVPQGGMATLNLSLRNTGTAAWTNSGSNPVRLGTVNPADRNSGFYKAGEWDATNRAAVLNEASVAPGEIGTFTFTVVGNPAPGHYPEYFAPVVENLSWMDNLAVYPQGKYGIYWDITVTAGAGASGYSASLVSKSDNPSIAPGDAATLEVVVKNEGTTTWSNTGANPIHLGTWNSQDRSSDFYDVTWLTTNRPTGLMESTVVPGSQGTFEFMVKVPSSKSEGTYTETFNLVAENLAWFNLPVTFTIDVEGVSTGDVTISLASDTPTGTTVPKGSQGVEMAKFKFVGEGTINSLTIHRYGVGAANAFDNVYLYEGNTRLTNGRSVSTATHEVEFNNIGFEVSGTDYLTVVADFDIAADGQHGFEIESSSKVSLSSVSGVFPVKGELFAVGDEEVNEITVEAKGDPTNPNVGDHADLGYFRIINNGSSDAELNRLTLLQSGDINNDDLTELELWADSENEIIAEASGLDGDKLIFDLGSAYTIPDGAQRNFTIMGTTTGRSGRTVEMYAEYTSDVLVIDTQYGVGAQVNIDMFDGGADDEMLDVLLQGGDITIGYAGPTSGDISLNGQDQVLLNFAITSASRDVDVRKVEVRIDGDPGQANDRLDDGGTDQFDDIKIRQTDSAYTASASTLTDPGDILMGPSTLEDCAVTGDNIEVCDLTFDEGFIVDGGSTMYLQVTTDVENDTVYQDGTRDYRASILEWDANSMKYTDTNQWVPVDDIVPSSQHDGNLQNVKKSTLEVSLDGSVSDQEVVKNQDDVAVVALKFTTGNDAVRVDRVKLSGYVDADGGANDGAWDGDDDPGDIDLKDIAQNIRLVHNGDVLAMADAQTLAAGAENVSTDGTVTFSGMNWDIDANDSEVVEVWFDVSSTATDDGDEDSIAFGIEDVTDDIDAVNEDGDDVEVTPLNGDINNFGGNPTVSAEVTTTGELNAFLDSGTTPDPDIIPAGSVTNTDKITVASFRLEAEGEGFRVDNLGFLIDPALTGDDQVAVQSAWISWDGNSVQSSNADLATGGSGEVKFIDIKDPSTNEQLEIAMNSEMIVDFQVILKKIEPTTTSQAYSDKQLQVTLDDTIELEAVGLASNDLITTFSNGATPVGKVLDVRRSKPTVVQVMTGVDTGFEAGAYSNKRVYAFEVHADPEGAIQLGQVCFETTISDDDGGGEVDYDGWELFDAADPSDSIATNTAGGHNPDPCMDIDDAEVPTITAGNYRTFYLEVDVAGNENGDSMQIRLLDDNGTGHVDKDDVATLGGANNFLWSDMSDNGRPDDGTDTDYTNGWLVDGLPTTGVTFINAT